MKRCPTCDKTFPDSMKFCQTDGTVLVADAPPVDPYKTVVGSQDEIASAIPPADPFKTMVASPPKAADDDILDLPDEQDALKTMVVSQEEMDAMKKEDAADASPLDLPAAPSAPLIEPQQPASPDAFKPKDSPFNTPGFGDAGKSDKSDAPALPNSGGFKEPPPSKFDSKTFPNDFSSQSPYSNPDSQPIPSPFQDSMPPGGFQPTFGSPFSEPTSASKPEPAYQEPEVASNQSPFGQAASSSPFEQNQWTPPPAPVSNWQNQEIGANTPFQPPVAAGSGQNQTLAIVSLVLGIVGIVICQLTAPIALVTGFMARKKAMQNPNEYGGSGFALAGMITGAIGTLLFLLVIIYFIFVFGVLATNGGRF